MNLFWSQIREANDHISMNLMIILTIFLRHRFNLLFPVIFFLSLPGSAQSGLANIEKADPIANKFNLTLQHTTVVVSDFTVSKKFYTEILGLNDLNADWLPEKQMFLSLGNNLELHVGEVEGVEINPSNFNHFAISTNDLAGYLTYLDSKGVPHYSLGGAKKYFIQKRADGVRQTFIQDPDGYWIEINDAN